jgi:V/A-type H+-transporting ATPase subunit I
MSVVPMQKVRLAIYTPDIDQVLDTIQRYGAVEFHRADIPSQEEFRVSFPYAELLPRVQHAVQFLSVYQPKKSLWRKLREGSTIEISETEITKRLANTDVILPLVEDFEDLQVEFTDVNERLRQLEEQHKILTNWSTLPVKLSDIETGKTKTLLVERTTRGHKDKLADVLNSSLKELDLPFFLIPVDESRVAVSLSKTDSVIKEASELFDSLDLELVTPPAGKETPDVELVAVSEKLVATKNELALLHDQAEHFAQTHLSPLQIASEILTWQKDRYTVVAEASAQKYVTIFDGWLNQDKLPLIEEKLSANKLGAVFSELPINDDEEPPVDIVNSPLIRPFEAVTRLYGMPGYRDLDPTVFLAGFFFLFFGLSLTDVGYGLFLMTFSAVVLGLFKVGEAMKMFARLLFFVGLATVLVGMAFGGYLGFDPSIMPAPLQALQLFDPIGNPLPVFYLALGLGVFQVMVGMILKVYSEYRNGRLIDGLLDQGPWFITFCLAILYLGTTLGLVSLLPLATIVNLIYVAVIMIVLASGRRGETFLGKIQASASGLYDSIGYFSDILSYSRLLALGLATTALAFAVNMIASMVVDVPYVGYLLAGIILIIGHLFTLAVNTLGAFIHSARLQFVEFFGKFITGTGREFSPLSRSQKHITVRDE